MPVSHLMYQLKCSQWFYIRIIQRAVEASVFGSRTSNWLKKIMCFALHAGVVRKKKECVKA